MRSLVFNSVPLDPADVVPIPQHPVYRCSRHRLRCEVWCWNRFQAASLKFCGQRAKAVLARGIGPERPLNVRGSLFVDLNGSDLATLFLLPDVDIADWRLADRTACPQLGNRFCLDLCTEVV